MAPALMSRTAVRPVAQMQKAKVQAPKPQKVRAELHPSLLANRCSFQHWPSA